MKYDEGIRKYRDTICVMDYAIESGLKKGLDKGLIEGRAEGLVEGMQKGRVEGEKQGRYEVALNLLEMRLTLEAVMQAPGLSKDEIIQLTQTKQ